MRAAAQRLADTLLAFDQRLTRRATRRPGRTLRLFALAILLFNLYSLTGARTWHDGLSAAGVCLWTSLLAIAPRGLYDGRADAWSKRHQVVSWLLMMVFLGLAGFLVISGIADDWQFGLTIFVILVGLAIARSLAARTKRPSSP
ncbi:hypothetical protein ACXJJ3_20255 [Kribbella sp. WER1]